MLEKNDLQQIRTIVREEIGTEIDPLKRGVRTLQEDVGTLKGDVKTLKSDMAKTRKDIGMIIEVFDRDYIDLRQRVEKLEEKVGIQ